MYSNFLVFAGEVLGTLCKKVGPETYGDVKDQILHGIHSNLEREMPSSEEDDGKDDVEKLVQKLSSSPGGEKVHCGLWCLNTTFNNISDILWLLVLSLVKETGVPRETN
jgi:hypothetical protein